MRGYHILAYIVEGLVELEESKEIRKIENYSFQANKMY
jgi:hypothetical protein